MNKRLTPADRHAVDLLLSRPASSEKPLVEMVFARPMKGQFEARLDAAEKVLSLLDHLPTPEPSPDLVARTMDRIASGKLAQHIRPTTKRTTSKSATRQA